MMSVDRRSLLERALWLAGAAAVPGDALAKVVAAKGRSKAASYLDAPTFALLSAVSDTVIPRTDTPGAVDAGVPRSFDALLRNWAAPATRGLLAQALKDVDKAAGEKGFVALAPDARHAVLSAHDKTAAKDAGWGKLKELVVVLYYLSEPGCTQELRYEHAPGAWEPSLKVTPETRAWGGAAMM